MATWNSRGLRGSTLEDLVNRTNEQYAEKKLALLQKIPTPITPVRMDKENRHITLAYFEQRSTVDYIGAVQGIPVCFDAKECCVDTFPLSNIHYMNMVYKPKQAILSYFFQSCRSFLLSSIPRPYAILEAHGGWRTQKFPKRRTERRVLSAEAERISGAISGRNPAGSQNAGLTSMEISTIIVSVLRSNMVAY